MLQNTDVDDARPGTCHTRLLALSNFISAYIRPLKFIITRRSILFRLFSFLFGDKCLWLPLNEPQTRGSDPSVARKPLLRKVPGYAGNGTAPEGACSEPM